MTGRSSATSAGDGHASKWFPTPLVKQLGGKQKRTDPQVMMIMMHPLNSIDIRLDTKAIRPTM